jgi:DEAD/DEAH box helicase domain-containing protein
MVANELNPTESVPADLYPLKQRGQGGPHREFPIRTAMEQEFRVADARGLPLGSLSFSQALREAYPGALYYYMARPYRVFGFRYRTGEIKVKRSRQWTTRPVRHAMVFPRFQGGVMGARASSSGFLTEVELQVAERVTGFVEQRGKSRFEHAYGPTSEFSQHEISRFFQTTGVCWYFADESLLTEAVAEAVLDAFCLACGVHARDLGGGVFRAKSNPVMAEAVRGLCIYDATNGSLRLTQRLMEQFLDIVAKAIELSVGRPDAKCAAGILQALHREVERLQPQAAGGDPDVAASGDWVDVIAANEKAMYSTADGPIEVEVVGHRYTPHGLMYELRPLKPGGRWFVAMSTVQALHGQSTMCRHNVMTGETSVPQESAYPLAAVAS